MQGMAPMTARDEGLLGATDELISEAARQETRVLITLDRDFCDIRSYPPVTHSGIIVLRPSTQDRDTVSGMLRRLLISLSHETPVGELWIVEPDRIRRRS